MKSYNLRFEPDLPTFKELATPEWKVEIHDGVLDRQFLMTVQTLVIL